MTCLPRLSDPQEIFTTAKLLPNAQIIFTFAVCMTSLDFCAARGPSNWVWPLTGIKRPQEMKYTAEHQTASNRAELTFAHRNHNDISCKYKDGHYQMTHRFGVQQVQDVLVAVSVH
jgi:hypothetical protein